MMIFLCFLRNLKKWLYCHYFRKVTIYCGLYMCICVSRLFYTSRVPKNFRKGYTCASSLIAPPASLLSPRSSLLQMQFRNWDILKHCVLRSISGSQAGGRRREETRRHKIEKWEEPKLHLRDWKILHDGGGRSVSRSRRREDARKHRISVLKSTHRVCWSLDSH